MYPFAFEFSSAFLVDLLDCVLSCRFGNFLCNSEKERQQCGIAEACGCLWVYLADLRAAEGCSHVHYNLIYDSLKHDGPILPPAAALASILWPQFHLCWSCPAEAQAAEAEAECWKMAFTFSELQKEKEAAEKKAREATIAMESCSAELQNGKLVSSSAMSLAKRASKESEAIKQAVQSIECMVRFSRSGGCTVDIENSLIATRHKFAYSPSERESESILQNDKSVDLSVSIIVVADNSPSNPPSRVCENFCLQHTLDGGCKWPDAGCAQLRSQVVGAKANFDAMNRFSIEEGYFHPE